MTLTETIEAIRLKYPTLNYEVEIVDYDMRIIKYSVALERIMIILFRKKMGFIAKQAPIINSKDIYAFTTLTEMMKLFDKYVTDYPPQKQTSLF